MLQQVCDYIHNYFIPKENGIPQVRHGDFTIASGVITPSVALKEGQRFLILGSDLNDSIYTYHESGIKNDDDTEAANLQDETFRGGIAPMALPKHFLDVVKEIGDWEAQYGAASLSPYTSESVSGVYSYTKATKADSASGGGGVSWQDIFKTRLNQWRKPRP